MGFYILNFVKILIRIFFEKGKREKEREREGEEWGKGGERINIEFISSAKWKFVCILCL